MKIVVVITLMDDERVLDTLYSLSTQSLKPDRVFVADASRDTELSDEVKSWGKEYGLNVEVHRIPGSVAESRNKTMSFLDEDIDFNIRCVKAGYVIGYNPKMIVFHYHRSSFRGFARQAFWNGYGRKQLNLKYPDLKHMHQHGLRFRNICRLGFGALGYLTGGVVR